MTIEEVIRNTANLLSNICVPVGLKMQIADPIAQGINNLNLCLQAFEVERNKQQAEQDDPDEPELHFTVEDLGKSEEEERAE